MRATPGPSGLRRLEREVVAAVVQVVRPVRGGQAAHGGAGGAQGAADRFAPGEVAVERRRKGRRRAVGDRPPGADEVRDAAAQEGLGETDAAVELSQRIDRRAQAPGLAGVEEDE